LKAKKAATKNPGMAMINGIPAKIDKDVASKAQAVEAIRKSRMTDFVEPNGTYVNK
jgi:hypothetical protein